MKRDVIIACDFASREQTLNFLDKFTEEKPFVKIGMELFYAEGPNIVREIKYSDGERAAVQRVAASADVAAGREYLQPLVGELGRVRLHCVLHLHFRLDYPVTVGKLHLIYLLWTVSVNMIIHLRAKRKKGTMILQSVNMRAQCRSSGLRTICARRRARY